MHDIRSWADVKNRLDSDRRCYGFFHPRLPGEPLIFVEVALIDDIADGITPLLDEAAGAGRPGQGHHRHLLFDQQHPDRPARRELRRFADQARGRNAARTSFRRLKTFATLSPIPGFRAWLAQERGRMLERLDDKRWPSWAASSARAAHAEHCCRADKRARCQVAVRQLLLRPPPTTWAGRLPDGKPVDPVARFHLGNGARVERLNWAGDPSPKGLKQSYGLMVNYLYDLKRLDKHRALLAQGKSRCRATSKTCIFKAESCQQFEPTTGDKKQ